MGCLNELKKMQMTAPVRTVPLQPAGALVIVPLRPKLYKDKFLFYLLSHLKIEYASPFSVSGSPEEDPFLVGHISLTNNTSRQNVGRCGGGAELEMLFVPSSSCRRYFASVSCLILLD